MQEQLQQMQHESEVAFNQIKLIKDQLNIEIAARIDAQTKNAELLQRNRELLTHIQQLLIYTSKLEMKLTNSNGNFDAMKTLPTRPTDLILPSLYLTSATAAAAAGASNQLGLSSDSPDSGKGKEISSESISDPFFATMNDIPSSQSWNRHNSTKTFSVADDLTIQSISIHETDTSMNKTSPHHHHSAYSSTSPSLSSSSSSSSSPEPIKSSQKLEPSKRKSDEPMYFDPLSTSTMVDQHVYHQILNPPTASSFTNSAFTQSPHRTATKEFDPFAK